jgi:uroporphyrin-III C-methyltransferase
MSQAFSVHKNILSNTKTQPAIGRVWLVGFGPGDPELLTIKGFKLLQSCDIIFYDDLLNKDFLKQFSAEKIYVGKRKNKHSIEQDDINILLAEAALSGKKVVRLKGGDPMVFAHGGEEVEFLKRHFVQVDVIPGITAAMAVSAAAQIPLTHRGISSSVTIITGHSENALNLPESGTVVIYMGASHLQKIAKKAIAQGRNPLTPVLLMYNVSNPNQEEEYTTLQEIVGQIKAYKTPLLIVLGDVVGLKTSYLNELLKQKTTPIHYSFMQI